MDEETPELNEQSHSVEPDHHLIIGAGPAGLTAAYELSRLGILPDVLEQSSHMGGISRTEAYKGYLFDIGGHRFYTKVPEIEALWREVLGVDFRPTKRLSRIFYDGKFYKYPLELFDTLGNIGLLESLRSLGSYLAAHLTPHTEAATLEDWVVHRFGRRLFERFFRTYTEKVWGVPCDQIGADWAAQRIQGLSLRKTIAHAISGGGQTELKTLIHAFEYPRRGPGMMWDAFADRITANGGTIHRYTRLTRLTHHDHRHIDTAETTRDGQTTRLQTAQVISSMPLSALIAALDPPPPENVLNAARKLRYRDFLIVGLIVNRETLFPDNWLYIHSPQVRVGRIQNFKNWSAEMCPDPRKTSLGMEYFCNRGDDLWTMADADLIALASREFETLGLGRAAEVEDGTVIRQLAAYPFYDMNYQENLTVLRDYLIGFDNLQTVGRNGLHRYNNQDHSMLTGLLAARNIAGERHDLWGVNTERSYYETFLKDDTSL